MKAELLVDCRNHHGEGILWNPADRRVWWTDIEGRRLWWFAPKDGTSGSFETPSRLCCFAPRRNGGLIVAFDDRVAFWDVEGSEQILAMFEPDQAATRLNDGRTDRQGRFIAGGMNEATNEPTSSVISVDATGAVSVLLSGVACANSICFSGDGRTMFFADTPERVIRAYSYDPLTGRLGPGERHADLSDQPGLPDGSCVDAEGGLWNAEWEGGRVVRIAPDGRIDAIVEVPVSKTTCCAFGGADLDELYITTSRLGSNEEQLLKEPHSGGLFRIKPGVKGLEDAPFAG